MAISATKPVKELTVEELKGLIQTTVRQVLEDEIEDRTALKSTNYVASIAEAREEYAKGKVRSLSELFPDA
jgi:hypothetical protein